MNIKPLETKDHPEVTHPVNPLEQPSEFSSEDQKDITNKNSDDDANELIQKQTVKYRIKNLLKRLNII